MEEVNSDHAGGFSKGATQKLSEETGAEKWVKDVVKVRAKHFK